MKLKRIIRDSQIQVNWGSPSCFSACPLHVSLSRIVCSLTRVFWHGLDNHETLRITYYSHIFCWAIILLCTKQGHILRITQDWSVPGVGLRAMLSRMRWGTTALGCKICRQATGQEARIHSTAWGARIKLKAYPRNLMKRSRHGRSPQRIAFSFFAEGPKT